MHLSSVATKLRDFILISSLATGLAAGQPALATELQKAGVAASTRNEVQVLSGSATGALRSGDSIHQHDRVFTGKTGSAELMLLDQTDLKIAPGSDVGIDRFSDKGGLSEGAVSIGVVKGSLRFATGAQDPRNYEIKTAVATITLRGTIVNIVATDTALAVVLADGKAIVVDKEGKTSTMEARGNIVLIGPDGTTVDQSGSLADAVAQLVQSSTDPAATAAQILAATGAAGGNVTAQNLKDIAAGIARGGVGADDLSAAVSDYVQGAIDRSSAATDLVNGARYLDDDLKIATGKGLAVAAGEIGKTDPTTAAEIDGIVDGSGDPQMQDSYSRQKGEETGALAGNDNGGDNLLQNQQSQQQQQSPN